MTKAICKEEGGMICIVLNCLLLGKLTRRPCFNLKHLSSFGSSFSRIEWNKKSAAINI